jgi:phage FluMu gp28-like protein
VGEQIMATRSKNKKTPRPDGVSGQAEGVGIEPVATPAVSQGEEIELRNDTVLRPYQLRWTNDKSRFTIAVKSAQIGYSTASAAWAVEGCLAVPRRTIIFLSRSERQSLELAQRAKTWLDGYHGVAADWLEATPFAGTSTLQHEIRFLGGSRIIALAANPDTARGYTGDVVLDEFAFHQDSHAIFTAVYRQVSLGYNMRVLSTPNGQRGKFYELAKQLGLDSGTPPARQPVRMSGNPWAGHWCDIFTAVRDGLPLNPQEVQAGCDRDTWLQEYCCQFISQASEWIPTQLFQQCVSSEATTDFQLSIADSRLKEIDSRQSTIGNLYAGWDVARNRDLSVIWLSELVGDVTWTRGVIEMRDTPTPEQVRQARALMPFVRRLVIDKSGMGLVIFEALEREFPGRIEGVQFTAQTKEAMAVLAKRRMEEAKVRLPDSDALRQSFGAVKKTVNAVGQMRFDAEHDARAGHADHWWAFCLAEIAAQQPAYHFAGVAALFGAPVVAGIRARAL